MRLPESLAPGHCFGILIWLGAIRVNDTIPSSAEDRATLQKLMSLHTVEEKEKQTKLELGSKASSESVAAFQFLLAALYLCWVHDVPLYISS